MTIICQLIHYLCTVRICIMLVSVIFEYSLQLACEFCWRRHAITHLFTQSSHLLVACSLSSLSHLLTASVIAAGFTAVTDHVCLPASCLHCISQLTTLHGDWINGEHYHLSYLICRLSAFLEAWLSGWLCVAGNIQCIDFVVSPTH